MSPGTTLEMGQRVCFWLKSYYPRNAAKLIARDFRVSIATAKRWLAGALPTAEHLAAMGARFGKRFLAFVYEPAVGPWRDYAYEEEIQDLRTRLDALERESADVD